MLQSYLSVLGYGQESSWASSAAPTTFFRGNPLTAGNEVKYRRISSRTRLTGTILNTPTFAGGKVNATHFATPETTLQEFRAILGSESVTGNVHSFSLADVPSSFTLAEWDGQYARAYVGARLEEWALSYDVKTGLTTQVKWWSKMAQSTAWSGAGAIETPTFIKSGTVSLGGSHVGGVISAKWNFKRVTKVLRDHTLLDTALIWPGPFVAECSVVLAVEDDALWGNMANGTKESMETTFDWLKIGIYAANFEEVQMDRSSPLLKQNVKLHAVYSDIDDGLIYSTVTV